MRTVFWRMGFLAGLVLLSAPALAHHPMGGATPGTFFHGLLSGLGHPVIGVDHFAFVIAVGLVAALHRAPYVLPAAFLAGMVGGVIVHLGALDLPVVEIAIALSVVVLGALAIRAKALPVGLSAGLIALSGVFHGYAYGEAIVGAEAAPLTAYFIGLVGIQYAIAASVIWIVSRKAAAAGFSVPARVAGGVVLGVGLVFLIQNVTSAVA